MSPTKPETEEICEFCEIDGQGNHAPRCPVKLERDLTLVTQERDALLPVVEAAKDAEAHLHWPPGKCICSICKAVRALSRTGLP